MMDRLPNKIVILCMGVFAMLLSLGVILPHIADCDELDRSATIIVDGKTEDSIVSNERHFRVEESTVIMSEYDKPIALADIPVPCKAMVEYRLVMDQDPVCRKIKVDSVFVTPGRHY